jgi:hypothetical protein
MVTTEAGAEMPVHGKHGKTMKLFSHPSHRPWKSIMPISTFPHQDYDEDEYFLKPAGLRDTHSEGKVNTRDLNACIDPLHKLTRVARQHNFRPLPFVSDVHLHQPTSF